MVFGITDKVLAYGLGVVCLLLAVALGTVTWQKHSAEAKHATAVAGYEKRIGAAERAGREASEKNRSLEGQLTTLAKENEDARIKSQAENTRLAAAARAADADNGRLRNILSTYASGSGRGAAPDTADTARGRAETLGLVLEASLRREVECAADAERDLADYRSLHNDAVTVRKVLKPNSGVVLQP
jgi:hypothetical protein